MRSAFAELASKYLKPLLLVLSVYVFFRGHSNPGGGFIAALIAATAIIFEAVAGDTTSIFDQKRSYPVNLISSGIIFILIAATAAFIKNEPVLTGLWTEINITKGFHLKAGTPLLFDAGVYFIVTGALILVFLLILEETEWK